MDVWEQIKGYLETRVSADAYRNWVVKTGLLGQDGNVLRVGVPDSVTKDWLETDYAHHVRAAMGSLGFDGQSVVYEVGSIPDFRDSRSRHDFAEFTPTSQLNTKFSFENFVVGSCNQFAHAAALAVAARPSKSYNPLFIYGGVGMGKTHLMHAIGRALLHNHPAMRIVYTSSERFMNEMINCIKNDRMQLFHKHYRSADVLLIDDIQILAGKERTQEEFFHTFNDLFEHEKQIVVSSDSAPKNTPGLVERLRSRFEWGLMVDVQPPDLETKMAILDKKAEADGFELPEDVRVFIATKTKNNIRELEGALVKLVAYSSVTGARITLSMAQQVLKHLAQAQEKRITMDMIIRATAEHFNMPPAQLKQKSNERRIAYPRQIAMFLAKELTRASLPEIGRFFGGKHHTTVLHSVNKIEQLRSSDAELNRTIQTLIDTIH